MSESVTGIITQVRHWTHHLFSIIVEAPINQFKAGQFAKISLVIDGKRVQRAYSYVNAPSSIKLEFYIVAVNNGTLSTRLRTIKINDTLQISKDAAGFFVLEEVPDSKNLWMLATGTGIGPYLSILQEGKDLQRFENIVLVHAVRFAEDLSYLPLMQNLQKRYHGKLHFQCVISRGNLLKDLPGRVPTLIQNGALESSVGLTIDKLDSHVMLCGNPQMVRDTQQLLQETRGMSKNLRSRPGHITSENYW
ncbi:ferredoxin--NADP(+) reductase [Candidatus Profftia tarda]|nr:ferredoxin--NADP(+) reductase [Candidatus Profftia tarda]